MRYQERIYIQTEDSALRNKKSPNANCSSDIFVFENPKYSISGTSVINCGCDCECPSGYTATTNCAICEKITITASTFSGTAVTVTTGDTNGNYGSFGTKFFENIDNLVFPLNYSAGTIQNLRDDNGSGNTVTIQQTITTDGLWSNTGGTTTLGRLNNVGVWMSPSINNQWFGFSHCLNIVSGGTYTIGIGGDNLLRFKLNGETIVNLTTSPAYNGANFKVWHMFPITLEGGNNIIELEGYNLTSDASFGAEIYSADVDVLSGLTSTTQLSAYTIFSTLDKIGSTYDLSASNGYSCPSGYSLSVCSGYTCVKIEKSNPQNICSEISGSTYVITADTQTIPITFNFTGNTEYFTETNASFRYGIYKYNKSTASFDTKPTIFSDYIQYQSFSATSATTVNVPSSGLTLDGEYIIKGFYNFNAQTTTLKHLNTSIDTSVYLTGTEYSIYNPDTDFYFVAFKKVQKPFIQYSETEQLPVGSLIQETIIPADDSYSFVIPQTISGFFMLTLNGLALSLNYDYTLSGNIVTMNSVLKSDDIITVTYTTTGGNIFSADNIDIASPVVSGTTGNQGNNSVYFNTSTGKYEAYTSVEPQPGNAIIFTLNGMALTNGIDYYQSTSDPKRIILEGDLLVGDIILIAYYPKTQTSNGINTNTPVVTWAVNDALINEIGFFTLEVSTDENFGSFYYTGNTTYSPNQRYYSTSFVATGTTGTILYYRVKNTKRYLTLCSNFIDSVEYSDVIPVTIQTNSINSY
jgi:hypothetical protein